MKIICVSNFDDESKSDSLICENINEYYGKRIVEFLIKTFSGNNSPDYYRLVDDDYKLYRWEP